MSKQLASRGYLSIQFEQSGDGIENLSETLKNLQRIKFAEKLDEYGRRGVEALREATPKRSGKTAGSWEYRIYDNGNNFRIVWRNSNTDAIGRPIAVLIQYGHATRNGGYVEGIDYINPAMKPIFEAMAGELWKEVERARVKHRR